MGKKNLWANDIVGIGSLEFVFKSCLEFNVIVEERVSVSKAPRQLKTRGVSHCGLAIYIKIYFKAKEEL
jgi:hypothetical protein